MDTELLIAATQPHGPPHGLILGVLAIAIVGWMVYRAVTGRKRSGDDSQGDRGLAGDRGADAPESNRGPGIVSPHGSAAVPDAHGRKPPVAASAGPVACGAVVSVRSLTKRYGEFVAVDDVTFSLQAGTVTGFLGPNGAGKTTTLRVLLGLAQPTGGEALVFGRSYRELEQPATRVGAVLESDDFDPGRSGRDHLRALAIAAEIPRRRVEEVLELVELVADRRVKTYSLGMRQRLGLAAALLGDPELLVLDEPANGLDPVGVHWLRGFLRSLAEEGRTVLVSSHLLAEVAQAVDRVIIIDRGRLVADARLDELTGGGRTLEQVYLEHLTTRGAS